MENKFYILNKNQIKDIETGRIITLNHVGMEFYKIYMSTESEDSKIAEFAQKFNVNEEIVKKDYLDFKKNFTDISERWKGDFPENNYMVLEPTNECSGKCIHCFLKKSKPHSWNKKEIIQYLEWIKEMEIQFISITGGEIFSPHYYLTTLYLLKKVKEYDLKILSISTNGIFLSEKQVDNVVQLIGKETILRFSMDALGGEMLNKIRPGYPERDLRENIRRFDDLGYSSVFTTIITNQTSKDIIEIINFLSNLKNIKRWNVRPAMPIGEKDMFIWDNRERIIGIYETILKLYAAKKIRFNFQIGNIVSPIFLEFPETMYTYHGNIHPCKNEKNQKTLKACGEITQCPMMGEFDSKYNFNLSNFNRVNIKKPVFSNLNTEKMKCSKCDLFSICGGGCRLYAISHGEGLYGCDINAKMTLLWIIQDKKGIFRKNWEQFYRKVKNEYKK